LVNNFVTQDWFDTYGIGIRQGRGFSSLDTATASPVTVVNEAFVRRFFPGRDPIGQVIAEIAYTPDWTPTPRTIIGVVSDSVDTSLRAPAYPTAYHSLSQWAAVSPGKMPAPPQVTVSVRAAAGSPAQLARSLASALTTVDRQIAFSFHPLADRVSDARQRERLVAVLSGFFGMLALGLAAIGLYGITAYAVALRRAEIGIRMALGAQRFDVVRLALRQTIVATVFGLAAGLAAAAVLTRYLEALLFGIRPIDPVTFAAAPAILGIVTLVACLLPARRAATIDPMIALRCD
jgi:hypothetical protein